MENTKKQRNEIRRKSFGFSKKGKIFNALEGLLMMGIGAFVIGITAFVCSLSSLSRNNWNFIIFITVIGIVLGACIGYETYSSYIWRFFKPDPESIKKYLDDKEKKILDLISSRTEDIKAMKQKIIDLPAEIDALVKTNRETKTSFEQLKEQIETWFPDSKIS